GLKSCTRTLAERTTRAPATTCEKPRTSTGQRNLLSLLGVPGPLEYATYLKALPKQIKQFLLVPDLGDRRKRIATMIDALGEFPLEAVIAAATNALEYGRSD